MGSTSSIPTWIIYGLVGLIVHEALVVAYLLRLCMKRGKWIQRIEQQLDWYRQNYKPEPEQVDWLQNPPAVQAAPKPKPEDMPPKMGIFVSSN